MTTSPQARLLPALLLIIVIASGCSADSPMPVDEQDPPVEVPETPIWPVSGLKATDADSVHAPYGPRMLPASYDFHAGIDLPAPRGTSVRAVLSGTVVQVGTWNGTSSGAGNSITIRHESGLATSYLHLDEIRVMNGAQVRQGAVVGTVGSTGATYPHLHLGYFPSLINNARDERVSRNPLEILPFDTSAQMVTASFDSLSVMLDVPLQQMTISAVEVRGETETRRVEYYAIVQQGSSARDEQNQSGLHIDVSRPGDGRFTLQLTSPFRPERVIVTAFDGSVILDAAR
ncbi:MAG: M23 family metallopeptidase [Gemmatimonadetes bacterium]|nr:M23 family metallopeptidase [Gemmatimonadota bacterium]